MDQSFIYFISFNRIHSFREKLSILLYYFTFSLGGIEMKNFLSTNKIAFDLKTLRTKLTNERIKYRRVVKERLRDMNVSF